MAENDWFANAKDKLDEIVASLAAGDHFAHFKEKLIESYEQEHKGWQHATTVILFVAGVLHAIPGPTQRLQSRMMHIPCWFLCWAGVLMAMCGAWHHYDPVQGLFGVSLCMGGAKMTGRLLRRIVMQLLSIAFSVLFLSVTIWANHHQHGAKDIRASSLILLAFIIGAIARYFLPTSYPLLRLLHKWEIIDVDSQAKICLMCRSTFEKDDREIYSCKSCGHKRLQAQCPCGNVYVTDSRYCRKCGRMRDKVYTWVEGNQYIMGRANVVHSPVEMTSSMATGDVKQDKEDGVRKRRVDSPRS